MIRIQFLSPYNYEFPAVSTALTDPDGLLAGGGDLTPERLLNAYSNGIFPWYQEGQPILWWSPSVRAIIEPENLKISRSLHKTLRSGKFTVTADQAFDQVIQNCAAPRQKADGTWITEDIQRAYKRLHRLGYAHSIETWHNGKLVGGLYGLAIGCCYFGESMFSQESDASKVAFVALIRHLKFWGYRLIDCQLMNSHLESLGATPMDRTSFIFRLKTLLSSPSVVTSPVLAHWHLEPSILEQLQQPATSGE